MGQSNLTFVAGSFQECLSYSIFDDDVKEESENFIVCVSSENPSVIFQGNNCTVVYIANNDGELYVLCISYFNIYCRVS